MQKLIRKNCSDKDRVCNEGQNEVFCKEVREFVNESRKCQTIYANFEGYHERILKSDGVIQMNQLDTIVFLTLSNGKDRISLTPDEFADTDKLTKLVVKKIIDSSTKFRFNEIRFQVVWIYYFDYLEKEMKSVPVFKVYKRSRGSEALYIDITLVEYDSWDNFIMFCKFPVSFICVPRRGEYTFRSKDGGDLLDLEFICKNSALRNKFYRTSRPVSQTLSQVMHDMMPHVRTVMGFLDTAINIAVLLDLHPQVSWFSAFVSIVGICVRIAERIWEGEESEKALESTAADHSLLFLNDSGEKLRSELKCLSLLSDGIKRPPRDKSLVDFIKLIKKPGENVLEILKYVPEFMSVSEVFYFIYAGVRGAEGNDPDIYNWMRLFQFLSRLSATVTGKNNLKKIGSEESEKCLQDLEKYSWEKVSSKLLAPPGESLVNVYKPPLDVSGPEESEFDVFGFRIYLLVKHSRADCTSFLVRLLKTNFNLQENTCYLDIRRDGQLIGLFIPFSVHSQNHAIIAVRLDKLPKIRT